MKTLRISIAVAKYGLEYLRGKPIEMGGGRVAYIHEADLDEAIALYADEPDLAFRHDRFYATELPNSPYGGFWVKNNANILLN